MIWVSLIEKSLNLLKVEVKGPNKKIIMIRSQLAEWILKVLWQTNNLKWQQQQQVDRQQSKEQIQKHHR